MGGGRGVSCASGPHSESPLQDVLRDVNAQLGVNVRMRVGVHVGWVVTGVVGRTRPRFHVYGPAVLTAEKMEQTGREGLIHCSPEAEAAYSASDFGFRPAVVAQQSLGSRDAKFSATGQSTVGAEAPQGQPSVGAQFAEPVSTLAHKPPPLPSSPVGPAALGPSSLPAPTGIVEATATGVAPCAAGPSDDARVFVCLDERVPPPAPPPVRLAVCAEAPSAQRRTPFPNAPGPGRSSAAVGRAAVGETPRDLVLGGTPLAPRLPRSLSSRSLRASAPPVPGPGVISTELRSVPEHVEGAEGRGANSAVRAFFSPLLAAAGADTPLRSVLLPHAIASDRAAVRSQVESDVRAAAVPQHQRATTPSSGGEATARQLRNEFEVAATFGA